MSENKKKRKGLRIVLTTIISIVLVIVLVVVGYFAYLMISYSRLEDNLKIDPQGETALKTVRVGETYTIVTQNLGFGAYEQDYTFFMDGGKESWARSEDAVKKNIGDGAAKVKENNPDFVLFQEVDFDSTRSYHIDESKLLIDAFPGYMYTTAVNYHSAFLMYPFGQPHGSSNSELMTVSRYEVKSGIRRSFPISNGLSKFLDLDRCYSKSYVDVENGKQLVLYNVHSSAYGGSDEIRNAQMTMLFNDIAEEYKKGNYCVCGGDFNHDFTTNSKLLLNGQDDDKYGWAQPFPVNLLPADSITQCTNYTTSNGDKPWPTCRNCDLPYEEGNFTIIVDGFLVTKNVSYTTLENQYTAFTYSDHCPVMMQFTLNA